MIARAAGVLALGVLYVLLLPAPTPVDLAIGVALGAGITAFYASARGWLFAIPQSALLGGVAASLLVGALAGLYPAVRASRLEPAEAVRSE